jgi:hypothetical protein
VTLGRLQIDPLRALPTVKGTGRRYCDATAHLRNHPSERLPKQAGDALVSLPALDDCESTTGKRQAARARGPAMGT